MTEDGSLREIKLRAFERLINMFKFMFYFGVLVIALGIVLVVFWKGNLRYVLAGTCLGPGVLLVIVGAMAHRRGTRLLDRLRRSA